MTTMSTENLIDSNLDLEFPEVEIESSSIDERARATFAKDHNRRMMRSFEDLFADDEK